MIDKLYEASNAGVKIQLEVRGICSWFPEWKEWAPTSNDK
jgi:polyphosphate kinase